MHRPVPLLHVVGREEVRDAGQLQQQPVLVAKHRGRSDDSRLGEDVPSHLLTPALEAELEGLRGSSGVVGYLGSIKL